MRRAALALALALALFTLAVPALAADARRIELAAAAS